MKKKPNLLPIFITLVLFAAGTTLAVLKIFFGYPYMIEAFGFFGLTAIMSYVSMINIKFDVTVELMGKIVGDMTKIIEKMNPLSNFSLPNIDGLSVKSFEIKQDQDGKISTNASPDEINFLKENGPSFVKEMFNTMTGTKEEQPLSKMSDKKLTDELKKAVDKEDFERANAIKKEIELRTKK